MNNTDVSLPTDAAARRRYEELETICRTAPIGLELVDRDLRCLRVNDRLAEFIGEPRQEILARTLHEVGKIDLLSVLQMQARVVGSLLALVNIRNDQLINRVNLHLVLGGSFEEETGKRVIEESAGE